MAKHTAIKPQPITALETYRSTEKDMGRGQKKLVSVYRWTALYRQESLCRNTKTERNEGGKASLKSPYPLRALVALQEPLKDNRKQISSIQ